jgi:NAD(P)H dehydrogenase (quinone)
VSNHLQSNLLVTGASGQLGRLVVETLLQSGATHIIAATRTPEKLETWKQRGVEIRKADFADPATLDQAFRGADRMLLISTDALHTPGLRLKQHRNAVAAAAKNGVKHVLYTSLPSPTPKPEGGLANDHFWTEAALFETNLDWTILRHNIYTDGIAMRLPRIAESGQFHSATNGGGRSYVTRADCARSDAAALTTMEGRQILEITGPESITQDHLADILSERTGKQIKHISIPPEELRKNMLQAGTPPFLADALVDFDQSASEGNQAHITQTVKTLTNKAPISVQDFLKTR